jgi:predicted acyltransferase
MDTTQTISSPVMNASSRLLSLDIFRGLTIAGMIIVNEPGIHDHAYAPLLHAAWNGITPTDFVFPFFVFMVGVSVSLSYSKQLQKGIPKNKMIGKIFRRAIILFCLGMLLSISPLFNFSNIRVPGVLQRIGIVYMCCSLLFLYTGWKFQARTGAAILILYCMVMTLVPVPGYGYPILEPGKNLAAWLDAIVIPGRMWQGTWDPEGILSTFPAIVTGITGMLTGHLLVSQQTNERKIIWLFVTGFISFAIANAWHWFFPINKNLWTSPFVLYTSGLAAMVLASLYFFVDVLGYKKWAKFPMIYGSNAIVAYVFAGIASDLLFLKWGGKDGVSANSIIINAVTPSGIPLEIISLAWAILFCLFCFIPVYFLYKKKLFLRI